MQKTVFLHGTATHSSLINLIIDLYRIKDVIHIVGASSYDDFSVGKLSSSTNNTSGRHQHHWRW